MECWIKINAVLPCFYYISDPEMNCITFHFIQLFLIQTKIQSNIKYIFQLIRIAVLLL